MPSQRLSNGPALPPALARLFDVIERAADAAERYPALEGDKSVSPSRAGWGYEGDTVGSAEGIGLRHTASVPSGHP
jgi:hypothetical protein